MAVGEEEAVKHGKKIRGKSILVREKSGNFFSDEGWAPCNWNLLVSSLSIDIWQLCVESYATVSELTVRILDKKKYLCARTIF